MRRAAPLLLAATLAGCTVKDEPPPVEPGALVFQLEPVAAKDPGRVGWLATYESGGKVARFRIELQPEPKGTTLPTFVRCRLMREPGSDGSVLLRDLARALEGRVPAPGPGVETLELEAALLGRDLSRGGKGNLVAGSFGSEPPGSWLSTKLFLGDGEGEVFLNLDPIGGYGEFSMKDPDYGNAVVRELARLLQGEVIASAVGASEAPESAPIDAAAEPPPPTATPDPAVLRLSEKAAPGVRQPERRQALESLARMGPRARDAVPIFLKALEDEDPIIRGEALRGLPALRPDPQLGIAAVTPFLKDPDPLQQVWAANALAAFGDKQKAVAYLTVFLKGNAKTWAAAGLMAIGPEARGAVPLLIEMLQNRQDPHEGYAACRALAAIGRDAASALPALREASQDVSKYVRDAATYAIREIDH
jgi:hypothetical protein